MEKITWTSDHEIGAIVTAFTISTVTWLVWTEYYIFSLTTCTGILIYSLYSYYKLQLVETWISTSAIIKKCITKKEFYSSQSSSYVYSFDCLYEYVIDDITYEGSRVTWKRRDAMTQDVEKHNHLSIKLKNRQERVYINPKNHSESVLLKTNTLSQVIYFISGFSAVAIITFVLIHKFFIV